MKIIKNLLIIDLNNKEFLLVNCNTGSVEVISLEEKKIIDCWINDTATLNKDKEKELYHNLLKKNYFLEEGEEEKIRTELINKLKKESERKSAVKYTATFVLTYNCNFNCEYCYEKKDKCQLMSEDMVDAVFNLNPDLKYINFFGGEPLLLSNRKIIEYIISKKNDVSYSLITNGYNIIEYMDILTKINVTNIQITLDGDREKHNSTRHLINGKGTYDKIIEGIKLCVKNKIPVTIRMNLSADNYENCLKEKKRIENSDWGKKVDFELQSLFQNNINTKNMIENILIREDNISAKKNKILGRRMPLSNFLYKGTRLLPHLKICDCDGQNMFYDALGYIYNCILAVGDIDKSIGEYYPNYKMKEKSFSTRDITVIKECRQCPYALLCGGGCPNGIKNSDLYSPNCFNFIYDIKYNIPLIYNLKNKAKK